MKFSNRTDIDAPQDWVFAQVTNFDQFERQALARGVEITRTDDGALGPAAATWHVVFQFRGRRREMDARTLSYDPPEGYVLTGATEGLEVRLSVELMALARERTRMVVGIEMLPKTLTARLLVQSLKVAKGTIDRRIQTRLDTYADRLNRRCTSA
ncbi:SRPBCC family protein [Rhodobacteraceae bacterium CCMM004]|nr:SRPBCC family protein [Rhodobacteraceae bacterium CCMM004]